MERPMTSQEKTTFKGWFPMLDVDAAVVTGEATGVYNCISWTVGVTDRWLWPGSALADFDTFYQQWGFVRAGSGPIAAWGSSTSSMTHGCVSGAGHGPRWESKCGSSLRIQHGLTELESSSYGRVLAFYSKARIAAPFAEALAELESLKEPPAMRLSSAEAAKLQQDVTAVPAEVQAEFRRAFEAWKETWFAGGLAIDSNPRSRARGKEFDALVALGPQVLPLVVETLADEENFFALTLYDVLQADARLIVQFAPDDLRLVEGEQGRAARVVKAWLAR